MTMTKTKAIIIDANCFSGKNFRNEIKKAISDGSMCAIVSENGKLAKELKVANVKRFTEFSKARRFYKVCNDCVERKTQHLQSLNTLTCNDAHVIALAVVSGANTLLSNDANLIADFGNCNFIERSSACVRRRGRVIQRRAIRHTSPNSRSVRDILRDASAKYEHCECKCNQRGC